MEISDVEWKERLDKIRTILEKNAQNPEAVYYGFWILMALLMYSWIRIRRNIRKLLWKKQKNFSLWMKNA